MNDFFDDLRSRLFERQEEFGQTSGAIRTGSAFILALSDEMKDEIRHIKKGTPREGVQILIDALQRSERSFGDYMTVYDKEIGKINEAEILNTLRLHEAGKESSWKNWGIPLIQGVSSNFLWLFLCGALVWIAFAIKIDWPSTVQSWFIGG